MNHTHNLNNDIMNALAATYKNMVAESHTHEELKKLSVEKLKELKAEYTKKASETEGEEKEKHEKELADIESILTSREEDKEEDKEEVKESAAEDTQKKAWELHQQATDPKKREVYGALAAQAARRSTNPTGVKIGVRGTEAGAGNRAQRRMGNTPKQAALPEWMQRRMNKYNTAADAEPVAEEKGDDWRLGGVLPREWPDREAGVGRRAGDEAYEKGSDHRQTRSQRADNAAWKAVLKLRMNRALAAMSGNAGLMDEAARVTPARQSVIDRALSSINPHKRDQAKMLDKLTIPAEMRGAGSDEDLKSELGRIQQMKRGKFKLGEEIQQVDEIFDSPAGKEAAKRYIMKSRAETKKLADEEEGIDNQMHSIASDSGMGTDAGYANMRHLPGGQKAMDDMKKVRAKFDARTTGQQRALTRLGMGKPVQSVQSEETDCGCNHVQESMEKINALKERAAKMREIGKNK